MIPLARLYLGIDGGGTATTAWLAEDRGRVVARGVAGPSNPVKVGLAAAKREILAAARQALGGASQGQIRAICVGLAGADRPQIVRPLLSWLRKNFPAQSHLVTSDAAITLEAALGNAPGVVIIAGTGSIAYGRNRQGETFRAGGWGSVFGDEGSAYALGRGAVAAALRDLDGVGPRTRLTQDISRSLALKQIPEVISLDLKPQQIAAVAPLVMEADRKRDKVARQLVLESGQELAILAAALIRRLGLRNQRAPVVLAGGLLRSNPALRRVLALQLRRFAPHARISVLRREPAEGALAIARRLGRG